MNASTRRQLCQPGPRALRHRNAGNSRHVAPSGGPARASVHRSAARALLRIRRAGDLIKPMVNKIHSAAHVPGRDHPSGAAHAPAGHPPGLGHAPRKRRGRGRPKSAGAGNVREQLLRAARELFLRYGYRAVSSRQIGAAAGVNFAMIRYYFGGKPGLYREILQGVLPPQIAAALQTGRSPPKLADILSNITRVWAANPWIAGFVLREVLVPGGPR